MVMKCNDKLCDNCLTVSIYQVLHILYYHLGTSNRKQKIVPSSVRSESDAETFKFSVSHD